jgi:glutathione reductase (NADPH)
VRGIGEQCAENHHGLHAELFDELEQIRAEAAPAHIGFDTAQQHHIAIAAGRRLADRVFGGERDRRLSYELLPTVVFSHPPIGTVGLSEAAARERYKDQPIKVYRSEFVPMFYALGDQKPQTAMKLVTIGAEEKVVGCHVIGPGADEMIQGFAVALTMGARKRDFDDTLAIHPTSAEEMVTMR